MQDCCIKLSIVTFYQLQFKYKDCMVYIKTVEEMRLLLCKFSTWVLPLLPYSGPSMLPYSMGCPGRRCPVKKGLRHFNADKLKTYYF